MEEIFKEYISNLNPSTLIVALIIVGVLCWFIFKNRKVISGFFNDLYNQKKNKEELLKTIHDNQTQIKEIMDNRTHDREQSLIIQKELIDSQKRLSEKQSELSNQLSEVIKSSSIRDEQINNLMVANREVLGNTINSKYKHYIEINGIPEDEIDEFTNLHAAYKGCGGNHSGDAKYEYCINHLPIIPVETKLKYK